MNGSPSLLFDVFALGQQVRQLLVAALAGAPLDPQEYAVASAVFEDEAPTPTKVARRLGMPLTSAMEHVSSLERRGLLRRFPNPRDGRSYLVTLTAAGRRAHRKTNERFEVAYAQVVRALDDPKGVGDALRRLHAAVATAHETMHAWSSRES